MRPVAKAVFWAVGNCRFGWNPMLSGTTPVLGTITREQVLTVVWYYSPMNSPMSGQLMRHSSTATGNTKPLYGNYCQCHWRWDLHQPAAFPWHAEETGPRSLMGGTYWHDNGDGTFTPLDGYWGGGHSWLDLYMMGLADVHEVPDTFILRNLREVGGNRWRGDREVVSINQIIAAEGLREPRAAHSQKVFQCRFCLFVGAGADALRRSVGSAQKVPRPGARSLAAHYGRMVSNHYERV